MENVYNTSVKSKILQLQREYLERLLSKSLEDAKTEEEANALIGEYFDRYYTKIGSPLLMKRPAEEGHLPYVEEYNETIVEMAKDIDILMQETGLIGDAMASNFNYAQNERTRIRNRIQKISGLASDLTLISNENNQNSVHFKDSFNDHSQIEERMVIGVPVDVSTEQGIITLKKTSVFNQSKNASIKLMDGDGSPGTYHITKQVSSTANTDYNTGSVYISDETPNDDILSVLDGRPDTIFEYQKVNIPAAYVLNPIKKYDIGWVEGRQFGDRLRLRLVIELEQEADVNWLNINPYYPFGSTGSVKVYGIRTSVDGFEYEPLYNLGDPTLNTEINITPQTYRASELFDGSDDMRKSKFSGQGVWLFPSRRTRFVEIILDQDQSYEEMIGHTYYERVSVSIHPTTRQRTETKVRIPSTEVGAFILAAPNGRYTVGQGEEYIDKKIEAFKGWRYAIGIRDINIMSYEYEEKSELISTLYQTERPIRNVLLYSNEKIPNEFLDTIAKGNEWIKYYISYDNINWHRISPMHHRPLGKENEFPAKIIEFRTNKEEQVEQEIHKTTVLIEEPIYQLRLKIVMDRPAGEAFKRSTPILEDYSLRVVLDEE